MEYNLNGSTIITMLQKKIFVFCDIADQPTPRRIALLIIFLFGSIFYIIKTEIW